MPSINNDVKAIVSNSDWELLKCLIPIFTLLGCLCSMSTTSKFFGKTAVVVAYPNENFAVNN